MKHCPYCESALPDPAKVSTPRSLNQHRRFFGLVRAAHFHWPETHPMQFTSEQDLRKWLTAKAGWRDIAARIPITSMNPDRLKWIAEAAFKAAGADAFPQVHKGELIIWVPRSIRFDRMPHLEFCTLSDAVEHVIHQETGLRADDLLKESATA